MSDRDPTIRADADLRRLEVRVEELLRICTLLKEENNALRARQESLVSERAGLIEKAELARTRVEAMISRLRSMESNP